MAILHREGSLRSALDKAPISHVDQIHPILLYYDKFKITLDPEFLSSATDHLLEGIEDQGANDLCKTVNLLGRFGKLSLDAFVIVTKRFEEICLSQGESVNLVNINMFLDGVVRSDLSNGNILVKKSLKDFHPGIKHKIQAMLEPQ